MTDLLLTNEPLIRVAFFLSILLALAVWEVGAPHRRREVPRLIRLEQQLRTGRARHAAGPPDLSRRGGGSRAHAQARGWGLLNIFDVPGWLAVVASILALDQ